MTNNFLTFSITFVFCVVLSVGVWGVPTLVASLFGIRPTIATYPMDSVSFSFSFLPSCFCDLICSDSYFPSVMRRLEGLRVQDSHFWNPSDFRCIPLLAFSLWWRPEGVSTYCVRCHWNPSDFHFIPLDFWIVTFTWFLMCTFFKRWLEGLDYGRQWQPYIESVRLSQHTSSHWTLFSQSLFTLCSVTPDFSTEQWFTFQTREWRCSAYRSDIGTSWLAKRLHLTR